MDVRREVLNALEQAGRRRTSELRLEAKVCISANGDL